MPRHCRLPALAAMCLALLPCMAAHAVDVQPAQKLLSNDTAQGDHFGYSVCISDIHAIVGAPWRDDNGIDQSGAAYVFQRDVGGRWNQVAKLAPAGTDSGHNFGMSVAFSGPHAIVGASSHIVHYNPDYRKDPTESDRPGSAYVFERDEGGIGAWGQVAMLTAHGGDPADYFGHSVSISGDVAVVGAWGDDSNGLHSGSAYVFQRGWGGTDGWRQMAKLRADDGAANDLFGESVSVSGDYVFVGARGDDDRGELSGSAYVFRRDAGGSDAWGQVAKLTSSDGAEGDAFGFRVFVSGGDATIAAPWDDNPNGEGAGSAYMFRLHEGLGVWLQKAKLMADDGEARDWFGYSASLYGDRAVVGAAGDSDNGDVSGSAYVFQRDTSGHWSQAAKLIASDGEAHDWFGYSVSLSADFAIAGAWNDDDNGSGSGSAHVFGIQPRSTTVAERQLARFVLAPNAPNPFNPSTTIRYELTADQTASVVIHDMLGRAVRTLADGPRPAGRGSAVWNGLDDAERPVASGIYVVRLTAGNTVRARRITLLR